VDEALALAEDLRVWLVEKWPEPEVVFSDVLQRGPSRLRDRTTARNALAALEEAGWLVPLEKGASVRGARRREAWRIAKGAS